MSIFLVPPSILGLEGFEKYLGNSIIQQTFIEHLLCARP